MNSPSSARAAGARMTMRFQCRKADNMSKFLRGLGNFVFIIGGLLGFVLSILVVSAVAGVGGVIASLFLFPLTFTLVPFYTLFVYGSWNLLLINYGSAIVAWTLYKIAENVDQRAKESTIEAPWVIAQDSPSKQVELSPARVESAPIEKPVKPVEQAQQRASESNKNALAFFAVVVGILILTVVFMSLSPETSSKPTPAPSPKPVTIRPTLTAAPLIRASPTTKPVSLDACVTNGSIRIRRGPGTQYAAFDGLASDACLTILRRNEDASWVYMTTGAKTGWVAAWLLTIEGDISKVPVQSISEAMSMVPTAKIVPTQKLSPTATKAVPTQKLPPPATGTPFEDFTMPFQPDVLCSQMKNRVGEYVTCKIERAYCDFLPAVDGDPTFCNDRPYPNQSFVFVVFGEDWSDYDGDCLMVSGTVSLYRGVPQILATSRSQVSLCQ
jgi:uncharacterized protein YraI